MIHMVPYKSPKKTVKGNDIKRQGVQGIHADQRFKAEQKK